MPRYVEVGVLKEWIENWLYKDRYYHNGMVRKTIPITELYDILEQLPTADVPDRKVGKWLEREVIHTDEAKEVITEWQSCKCSVCGCYDTRPYLYCFNKPRFCSWCGADMRGEDNV